MNHSSNRQYIVKGYYDDRGVGRLTHADLLYNTNGDNHTQYALLAGRSSGQTLIGGAAAGENLILQSTAHNTRGYVGTQDDFLIFSDTYNYGAFSIDEDGTLTISTIADSFGVGHILLSPTGFVGINNLSPSCALDITGSLKVSNSLSLSAFGSAGLVHNSSVGLLSSSLLVDADVSASAAITRTKLANINTSRILGRGTASAGAEEELTLSSDYGVTFTYSAGGLKVNTPQDLQTSASPVYAGETIRKASNDSALSIECYSKTNTHQPTLQFKKSDNATLGTAEETDNGDLLAVIEAHGVNSSSSFHIGSDMLVLQDGPSGETYIPSSIIFRTGPNSAERTERLRIESTGNIFTPKIGFSVTGGLMIKLTNKTGGNSVAGEVVTPASATSNAVIKVTQNVPNAIGVFYESGVADGQEAWIVVSGIADVYFIGSVTRGQLARTFVTADGDYVIGQAKGEDVPTSPFATDKHFCEIGHILESRTGAGAAKCVLHFN